MSHHLGPVDDDPSGNTFADADFDPDRLSGCAYWRCDEIFERRSANHRYCRKACRSRQHKWERAQERKRVRTERKRDARVAK